jgi:2-polyprenyl-3-methyl-5-hydroxy-6-metoxy-1,4-benzoquinol methylase
MSDLAQLSGAVEWLAKEYPLIARNLSPDGLSDEPLALTAAQSALDYAAKRCRNDPDALAQALDSFAEISFDFLRRQARFMKTGKYALTSADGLADDLYRNEDLMRGHYLDGLLMTYALWPNHARFLEFLDSAVCSQLGDTDHIVEVGVGHGLMATRMLQAARTSYTGIDLSPHAIAYCIDAFGATGISEDRWNFIEGDATSGGFDVQPANWLVCCEVLEHVDDPRALLESFAPLIAPGGHAFVTTVANLEAEDHVYLFDDAAHIRRTIAYAGFTVEAERALVLPGYGDLQPLPLNYAAVIAPVMT